MQSALSFLSRWSPRLANKAYSAGLRAYRSREYGTALATFRVLADHNSPEVQVLLARMYRNGEGTPVDHVEAAKWTRLAAESGHAEAAFILGALYEDGIGISKDISQALHWYRLSAQQGLENAQINLARCFHVGLGVDQDESVAAWWVSHAAEQGDVDAQLNLGYRYLHGMGVDKSEPDAFFWFDLAAKAGNGDAATLKANIAQQMTPNELARLERDCLTLGWKPKSAEDSAYEVFAFAARQTIERLIQILGQERFAMLKTTEREWPTIGEVVLKHTHGYTLATIASNLRNHSEELDRFLDLKLGSGPEATDQNRVPTAKTILGFIRRIDDLADAGTVIGERTADLTHNLMEYHLSLVRELEVGIDSECLEALLTRFSVKQGLRASRLIEHSGLRKVLLPISPW